MVARAKKFFSLVYLSVVAATGHAGEWANIATSSNTVPGHICDVNTSPLGNYDIDCPETNPEITASGVISATGISVTGAISTTSLFVNGTPLSAVGSGIPKYTTTERDNLTPAQGDVIYNLTEDRIEWFDGSFWRYDPDTPELVSPFPVSCIDILNAGNSTGDGVYAIDPDQDGTTFDVYCDMTTDGGGWIRIVLNDPGNDNVFVQEASGSNTVNKCSGNEFQYAQSVDNSTYDVEYAHGNSSGSDTDLVLNIDYFNPATASNFSSSELDELQSFVSILSSSTAMVSLTCDDDGVADNHEITIHSDINGGGLPLSVTPYTSDNENYSYAVFSTSADTGNDTPLPSLQSVDTSLILPRSITLGGSPSAPESPFENCFNG